MRRPYRLLAAVLATATVASHFVFVKAAPIQSDFQPVSYNELSKKNANGSSTSQFHEKWVNFTDGKTWKTIDLTPVTTGTGVYINKAPYTVHFPRFADGPSVFIATNLFDATAKAMRTDPPIAKVKRWTTAQHVAGSWVNGAMEYTNALPGIGDIVIEPHEEELRSLVRMNAVPDVCVDNPDGQVVIPFRENYANGLIPRKVKDNQAVTASTIDVADGFAVQTNSFRKIVTRVARVWDSGTLNHLNKEIVVNAQFAGGIMQASKIINCSDLLTATYPVFTDTSSSFFSGTGGDGQLQSDSTVYGNAQSGNNLQTDGGTTDVTCGQQYHSPSGHFYIWRSWFPFDTSSLPDNAVVSAATISLFGVNQVDTASVTPTINIVSSTEADPTLLATGDWSSLGTTAYSTITYAGFSTVAYNDFSLSAGGIADISLTGYSKYGCRSNRDISSTAPSTGANNQEVLAVKSAEQAGTTNDPTLAVTYTAATSKPKFIIIVDALRSLIPIAHAF